MIKTHDGACFKRTGRPALFGERATRLIQIVVTEDQHEDLKRIASDNRMSIVHVVRHAVDEYVGDYRERRVFFIGDALTRR